MAHNLSLDSADLFAIWPAIKVDQDSLFLQLKSECCAFCTGMGKVWKDSLQSKNRLLYNYSFMCVVSLGPSGSLGDKLYEVWRASGCAGPQTAVHCRASYSNTTVCRTSMDGRAMPPCVARASDAIPQTAGFPSLGRGFGASGEIWPQS